MIAFTTISFANSGIHRGFATFFSASCIESVHETSLLHEQQRADREGHGVSTDPSLPADLTLSRIYTTSGAVHVANEVYSSVILRIASERKSEEVKA